MDVLQTPVTDQWRVVRLEAATSAVSGAGAIPLVLLRGSGIFRRGGPDGEVEKDDEEDKARTDEEDEGRGVF